MTILYFNFGIKERINVGLMMFNDNGICLIKIKKTKMSWVNKTSESFSLFEYAVNSFVTFYKENIPEYNIILRTANYNNGVFKIDQPSYIEIDLTKENFNRFFDKHI